jgi:hypothetical protein
MAPVCTHARPQVSGDYFQAGLVPARVAYAKYQAPPATAAAAMASPALPAPAASHHAPPTSSVLHRRWTLGEVVSAAARAGLHVVALDEEAGAKSDDAGLPKVFTLVAEKWKGGRDWGWAAGHGSSDPVE